MSSSAITTDDEVKMMSIANNTPLKRRPTHPGEVLREDFMPDYGLTVSNLANALGVSRQTVNELVRERRALSPEMSLRLSASLATPLSSGSISSAPSISGMQKQLLRTMCAA